MLVAPAGPMIVNTIKKASTTPSRISPRRAPPGVWWGRELGERYWAKERRAALRGGRAVLRNGLTTLAGTEPIAALTIDKIGTANNDAIAAANKVTPDESRTRCKGQHNPGSAASGAGSNRAGDDERSPGQSPGAAGSL